MLSIRRTAIVSCLMLLAAAATLRAQELSDASFRKWLDHIRPGKSELTWYQVPWRPTLGQGMRDARQKDRPILLWAMNGHPLACV